MQTTTLILSLVALAVAAYLLGRDRSLALAGGPANIRQLHSLPGYYGYYTAIWALLPALGIVLLWVIVESRVIIAMVVGSLPDGGSSMSAGELNLLINNIRNLATGDVVAVEVDLVLQQAAESYNAYTRSSRQLLAVFAVGTATLCAVSAWRRISPEYRARNSVEGAIKAFLIAASSIAIFTTIGIVLSVLFEAILFFREIPVADFLFGLNWSPQTAIRADQVGSSGSFGAVPLFAGTLLITGIAMLVAVPVGPVSYTHLRAHET